MLTYLMAQKKTVSSSYSEVSQDYDGDPVAPRSNNRSPAWNDGRAMKKFGLEDPVLGALTNFAETPCSSGRRTALHAVCMKCSI